MFQSHSKVPVHLAKDDLRSSSKCLGAEMLMKLLANYCRNQGIKTAIRVGIVGKYCIVLLCRLIYPGVKVFKSLV